MYNTLGRTNYMPERLRIMDADFEREVMKRETMNEQRIRLSYHGKAMRRSIREAVLEGLEYYEGVLDAVSPYAEWQRRLRRKSA